MRCSSAIVALLLTASACTRGAAPGPRPERVEPPYGDPAGATAVVIRGAFPVKAVQSLAGPSGNAVDATYRAWLGGTALGQVRWLDEGTLSASVPGGLAPGLHALEVEDPSGRRGALAGAFFAGVPAVSLSLAVNLSRATLSVGQPLAVQVAVTNGGNVAARGVLPAVALSGAGALSATAAPAARDVAAGGTETYDFGFTAASAGSVTLDVGAGAPSPTGGTSSAAPWSGTVRVQAPAALLASLAATPPAANLGQTITLTLTVDNTGEADASAVAPAAPAATGTGSALLQAGPTPPSQAVPGGQSRTFQWTFTAQGAGPVVFDAGVSGTDANSGAALAAGPATSNPVQVLRPAALSAALVAPPATVSVGQAFTLAVDVANGGESAAAALAPALDAAAGTGACAPAGPALPASATAAGGSTLRFTRGFTATAPGAVTLRGAAAGVDATDGRAVSAAASAPLVVQVPASLTASLSIPPAFAPGDFTVTLTVANAGEATATGVLPGALAVAAGSSATAVAKVPFGAAQDVPGGEARSFTATWTASGAGALRLDGSAAGADGNSGAPAATGTVASNAAAVGTPSVVDLLAVDPFGDGSRFLPVNGWLGQVLVGPNDRADALAVLAPGGGTPALRALALPKDTRATGSLARNGWSGAPPYPSLGSSGCFLGNNDRCGPDNEAGRGLFATVPVAGAEWAVAGPVRELGDGHYLYLAAAADDAATLPFRYLDLTRSQASGFDGLTAAAASGANLFAGFGGSAPQLVHVRAMPDPTGLDVSSGDGKAPELGFDLMPGVGRSGTPQNSALNPLVDSLAVFGGLLHAANNGGMVRATVAAPESYASSPGHWAACTPSAPAWAAKASVTTLFTSGLEPRARAVPALVPWQGRLLAIRNTQDGPQLWSCNPAASGDPAACDPGDWSLVAQNLSGDAQLSQLGDAGNTRATLLVATGAWLYLGFDNGAGVQLYRTAAATPVNASDFQGQGGCAAGTAGCQGLGGNGLGDAARSTRFQDGKALSPPGAAGLYFTTGNGSDPARLHRILD